jgi:hypothetical protein
MGRFFGLVMVVVVMAIGLYVYTRQTQSLTSVGSTPNTVIDVTAVRNDLMALANAERRYFALNAKYVSLEELRANGDIHIPTRANYTYEAEASETSFIIVAKYTGSDPEAPQRLTVDETMTVQVE